MIVTQTNIPINNQILVHIEISGTLNLEDAITPVLIGNITNNFPNKNISYTIPIQTQYNNSQQNGYAWVTIQTDGSLILDCPLFNALASYTGSFNIQNTVLIQYLYLNAQNPTSQWVQKTIDDFQLIEKN